MRIKNYINARSNLMKIILSQFDVYITDKLAFATNCNEKNLQM